MSKIYFASNRDVKFETSKSCRNLGVRFNADGPQFFRVGSAEATLSGDPHDDLSWSPGHCRLYPEQLDTADESRIRIGSPQLFSDLSTIMKEGASDLVIFLHGFANSFPDSVIRTASLQEIYGRAWRRHVHDPTLASRFPPIFIMFSWPSNGNVYPAYEYFSDREDAESSGLAMARALERFVQFLVRLRNEDRVRIRDFANQGKVPPQEEMAQCHGRIHLMAHSMGNWALRHALLKYADLVGRRPLPRIIDHVFLMAADEDADALSRHEKLSLLTELASNIHVYHSQNDTALQISDKTKGNPDRLGADGPENFAQLNERISAVDCRFVDHTELSHGNHQYYRLREEVINDVLLTIARVPLDNREGRDVLVPGRSWRLRPQ